MALDCDEAPVRNVSNLEKTQRIGVAGLGVVGGGVAIGLADDGAVRKLDRVLVRDLSRPRDFASDGVSFSTSVEDFVCGDLDIIVDALPDGDAGVALIEKALSQGISIVSANKQALAGRLQTLHGLARDNNARLLYSASVGGGAPMIETVTEAREKGDIVEISAIVNGTVNFILTKLSGGAAFDVAVREAQVAGFAEPDPSADLSGDDARAKLSILSYEAFGVEIPPDTVKAERLTVDRAQQIANSGGIWRQISSLKKNADGSIAASVVFTEIERGSIFAEAQYEDNALIATTANGDAFTALGKGAGRGPTVRSIFSDLVRLEQN